MGLLQKLLGLGRAAAPVATRSWLGVSSSNLEAIRWAALPAERRSADPVGLLQVRFHSGSVYEYKGVPLSVYQALLDAPSKGKYHHRAIRLSYPYRRL